MVTFCALIFLVIIEVSLCHCGVAKVSHLNPTLKLEYSIYQRIEPLASVVAGRNETTVLSYDANDFYGRNTGMVLW